MQYYCQDYPILNLTLELFDESLSHLMMLTYLPDENITAQLQEDGIFTIKLWATNSVGKVMTDNWTICKSQITGGI